MSLSLFITAVEQWDIYCMSVNHCKLTLHVSKYCFLNLSLWPQLLSNKCSGEPPFHYYSSKYKVSRPPVNCRPLHKGGDPQFKNHWSIECDDKEECQWCITLLVILLAHYCLVVNGLTHYCLQDFAQFTRFSQDFAIQVSK